MKTSELLVLHELELIPAWILDGWFAAQKKKMANNDAASDPDSIAKAKEIQGRISLVNHRLGVSNVLVRLSFWIAPPSILVGILTPSSASSVMIISGTLGALGILLFIIGSIMNTLAKKAQHTLRNEELRQNHFWNRIEELNAELYLHHHIRLGVLGHKDRKVVRNMCTEYLVKDAKTVLIFQSAHGPLSEDADRVRAGLKRIHGIFMDFNLASEDWTKYFTEAQKQIDAEHSKITTTPPQEDADSAVVNTSSPLSAGESARIAAEQPKA